ncbi:MAG TPA: phosphatidate cytidylyltransferase [Ktedonobacterales bacterium]|nr:phosphatidate cytidylyltransferase [Ktedonobacterales bacterium]
MSKSVSEDSRVTPAPQPQSQAGWLAGLRQRLLSAGVLIPIVIALVWFGGWIAFAGAVVALALGMWEIRSMFAAHRKWYPLVIFSGAFGIDLLVAAMLPEVRLALIALGISALVIASFTWVMITRPTIERTVIDWALTIAVAFYLGWPMALFLVLRGSVMGYGSEQFWWVLGLFCMVWANDTAAFVTGHFLGRRKLALHISPAKTWEGFAGGLVWSVIAAFVLLSLSPVQLAWYHALVLGILVAVASTLGDLAESLLKRVADVKDSGAIVPGHGGILDRIDSLLFAVAVVFFYAAFLHPAILGG